MFMQNSGKFIITASRVFAACIRVHHVIKQNKTTATTCLMDFRTMFMGFQNCSIHGISSIDHGQTISSRQHDIGKQHHVTLNNHHQTRQTKCKGVSEHVYEILNCSRVLASNFMVHQPIEIKQSWQPTTTFRMLMQHISIATNTHRHENSGQGRFGMNNSTHKKNSTSIYNSKAC